MSLLCSAPTLQDTEHMIKTMPREYVIIELKRATQKTQFYTLSERIKHEGHIARLRLRLAEELDPRIGQIIESMQKDKMEEFKTKMLSLTKEEMDELWFVYKHMGSNHVAEILAPTYVPASITKT